MNHRDRVLTSMHRQEPDRVPLFYRDVPEVEARLLRDLELPDRESLLRRFDIDFRWVEPVYIGPPLSDPETGNRNNARPTHQYLADNGDRTDCSHPCSHLH